MMISVMYTTLAINKTHVSKSNNCQRSVIQNMLTKHCLQCVAFMANIVFRSQTHAVHVMPSQISQIGQIHATLSILDVNLYRQAVFTVPERKFVTKIRVCYHDPRWRRQQPVRKFTPRFLPFRTVFHVFDAGYRTNVSYCFYVIPESVLEFDKTAVNWCTKNTEDLGNFSVRSW